MQKIEKLYEKLIYWVTITLVFALTLICMIMVFGRYFLRTNLKGLEELPVYFMIAATWLGSSIAAKNDRHVKIDLIQEYVKSESIKKVVSFFIYLLTTIAYILFTYLTFKFAINSFRFKTRSAALQFPLWYINTTVFVGTLASTYFYMIHTIKELRWLKR